MNLTIDQRLRRRLRSLPGDWLARLLIGALAAILIVQLVRLLFALVTPMAPVGDWRPRSAQELAPAARAALFARVDPFYRSVAQNQQATSQVTSLQIQLYGVRVDGAAGSAIIAGSDGIQKSVGIGEDIQTGVKLVAVLFDHVEIDNTGKRELLYLDQSQAPGAAGAAPAGAATAPAGPQPNTPPAPSPLSVAGLRAGIAFSARTDGGRVTGIAVGQQGDGQAFNAVGFRTGDVIRSINGRRINGPGDVAGLSSQIQPGARISLEIERGAGTIPLAITIPQGTP
jgi:general secretion pathway protein C